MNVSVRAVVASVPARSLPEQPSAVLRRASGDLKIGVGFRIGTSWQSTLMVRKLPVGRTEKHLPLVTEVPSANENETSVLGAVCRTDEFFVLDSQQLGGTAP
jgi:hypothetical protein